MQNDKYHTILFWFKFNRLVLNIKDMLTTVWNKWLLIINSYFSLNISSWYLFSLYLINVLRHEQIRASPTTTAPLQINWLSLVVIFVYFRLRTVYNKSTDLVLHCRFRLVVTYVGYVRYEISSENYFIADFYIWLVVTYLCRWGEELNRQCNFTSLSIWRYFTVDLILLHRRF